MLTSADFITLPYTPDLSEGGIAYAVRSLPHTYDRMGGSKIARMRRIAAGTAVELAFRRLLDREGITFDTLGSTPFTEPDRYDVSLGGRRVDVKSFLLTSRRKIRSVLRNPARLLEASALIPSDQMDTERLREGDVYLFAFLLGLVTRDRESLAKAQAAGHPVYLVHPLPPAWASPRAWRSLGALALKSEQAAPLHLELGGQDGERRFRACRIPLQPRTRRLCGNDFYTLVYVHSGELPQGRVGLSSPVLGKPHIIPPLLSERGWGNLWVYGMKIILAGYLTKGEFRRRARRLPPGSATFQYRRTRTENFSLPVKNLRPLSELLQAARQWQGEHGV